MHEGPAARYAALAETGAIRHDAAQARAAAALDRLHRALEGWRPGRTKRRGFLGLAGAAPAPRGLWLHGDVGRGKSMLMDLFFDAAPASPKRRVHFHAFMQEVHAAVKAAREAHPGDPILRVARGIAEEAHLLCFDEFQVTDIADAMILGRLFEHLFAQGLVVVATSNRHPDDLYKGGLNRQLFLPFIALLKETLDILALDGPTDYRLERMAGIAVYHWPLSAAADAALDAAWAQMTGTAKGKPVSLTVQGRTLSVPQAASGVARFPFPALCEAALGPADYLALAHTFHTIMVDRIPRMGPESRNAAKRFVTLIDAMYEAKAKLVCSADAPPAELYPAGDGSFEFQRTVSRLIEMQSADYLALGHMG